jgi:tetratricopeptide (TPR) repeat protein
MSDHGFHPDHLRPKAIPRIPAGPAIEHRDFGILALSGPGFKKDELLYGASVLDITPTILTLFGLPVGEDMDGKVLAGAFENPPEVSAIPSWEEVPGRDGRHPPHTRLDPEAARESLQQLVALGYIEKPNENREKAVADTVDELRYNLGQAYQDAGRHAEALEIFQDLYRRDPIEQRHAVHCFVSCQALGRVDEMREIVEYLDGPRREKFQEAAVRAREFVQTARKRAEERKAAKAEAPEPEPQPEAEEDHPGESLLNDEEKKEFGQLKPALNFNSAVIAYLRAQVFAAGRQWAQALDSLQKVQEADLARPGLFLQTADLYRRLRQWDDAEATYRKALAVDPDNPHAHIGLSRIALRRRDFRAAAQSALDGLQRLYHNPQGHFLLGVALVRLQDYERARAAFETALGLNPNFRQAHLRLGYLFRRRLRDEARAAEHFRLFRELRDGARRTAQAKIEPQSTPEQHPEPPFDAPRSLPPLAPEEIVIVSGLPRSGTSMLMQMLAAGGLPVLTDGQRGADEDNPRRLS